MTVMTQGQTDIRAGVNGAVQASADGVRTALGAEQAGGTREPVTARSWWSDRAHVPNVAIVIVTWNRADMVSAVLEALSRQSYPLGSMHIVVVDNAGTDGTLAKLDAKWNADRVVENQASVAHEPKFQSARTRDGERNRGRWGSLTIVRNNENFGGCGGFNTGFAYVDQVLSRLVLAADRGESSRPANVGPASDAVGGIDFVWLVDDDIDLPTDALEELMIAMQSDPKIGLVGSRTVDLNDRTNTIETTIYFDRQKGIMCPEPPEHHPQHAAHGAWVNRAGGRIGRREFRAAHVRGADGRPVPVAAREGGSLLDVDIASACSLLARWPAVVGGANSGGGANNTGKGVGFWDWRYFIYCDDADWSLRFAKSGWRIVLNLNAVVFHTPWLLKLTPQRLYYAQRNAVWMVQKVLPEQDLRRVTAWWMRTLLKDAWMAAAHRRRFHAGIILQTLHDIVDGRTGKTAPEGPSVIGVDDALRGARKVLVLVPHAAALDWARAVVERSRKSGAESIEWTFAVSNRVPGFEHGAPASGSTASSGASDGQRVSLLPSGCECMVYADRAASKLKKQLSLLGLRPDTVVVFDQSMGMPVLWPGKTVHIDSKSPEKAQVERETVGGWVSFGARWVQSAVKGLLFARRVRPYESEGRYG